MGKSKSRRLQIEDKRKVFFMKLVEACSDFPDYSAGDILYTVLREKAKTQGEKISFLRVVADTELCEEADFQLFAEMDEIVGDDPCRDPNEPLFGFAIRKRK